MSSAQAITVWVVCACAVAAILLRPWRTPEWIWAVLGAIVAAGASGMHADTVTQSIARGADVYAFLAGILLLAELGRSEHVFDGFAVALLRRANGSPRRFFALVYAAGIAVTMLLSNDTTIVVLTPAILAAVRRGRLRPMPHLYACAFVANAASFVLPISNPANLVLFGRGLPPLMPWIGTFGLSSAAAIGVTFLVLRVQCAGDLGGEFTDRDHEPAASRGSSWAAALLVLAAAALVVAALLGWNVGATALISAIVALAVMAVQARGTAAAMLRHAQWSIIPLVAGLFVMVSALDRSGAIDVVRALLHESDHLGTLGHVYAGIVVALASNIFNNLPVGLAASVALSNAHVSAQSAAAALVAIDLGPNLAVSGSLATLLWLTILRREGIDVTPMQFIRIGAVVVAPALLLALLLAR